MFFATGCELPGTARVYLPSKSMAHHYFMLWDWDGTLERIHHALCVASTHDREGREASPSTAVIDSQSAKGAQKDGFAGPASLRCGQEGHGAQAPHPRRYTRPVVAASSFSPSDVQDRDGARELLRTARRSFPFIETIFADGGYQGPRMAATVATTG